MSHFIRAIYEQGVFRPLQPVPLVEHQQVSIIVNPADASPTSAASNDDDRMERQQESLMALRSKMDALPSAAPHDGLGGADHDQILYVWQK
jgi:predicted DNA-binding antitoxin AbrB/MazE fold protein